MMQGARSKNGQIVIAVLGILSFSGCASRVTDVAFFNGKSNETVWAVQEAKRVEATSPAEAVKRYEEVFHSVPLDHSFQEYQQQLTEKLSAMQSRPDLGDIDQEDALGMPAIYGRWLIAVVNSHQGMARLSLARQDLPNAEQHVNLALSVMKERGTLMPYSFALSLQESYRLLHDVLARQRLIGKAMIAKFQADSLDVYLKSESGAKVFYSEKALLFGDAGARQFDETQKLVSAINKYRQEKLDAEIHSATAAAYAGAAALQASLDQSGVGRSGASLSGGNRLYQYNNGLVQMALRMSNEPPQSQSGQRRNLGATTNPWTVPTFSQQLVDGKIASPSRAVIKRFASEVATAGGTGALRDGAQQVSQEVEGLPTVAGTTIDQKTVDAVTRFAGVFNDFLALVQEIKK